VVGRLDRFMSAASYDGLDLTHQRLEIFREVSSSLDHPGAESVFRGVRRLIPTVSIDTVYGTLWMLNDLGLITPLGPQGESVRFDASPAQHHHYVCVRSGLAKDFESADLGALPLQSLRQNGRQDLETGKGPQKARSEGIERGRSAAGIHDPRQRRAHSSRVAEGLRGQQSR